MPLHLVPPERRPLAGDVHESHQHPVIANMNQVVTATDPLVEHILGVRPGNRAADPVGDGVGHAGEITQVGEVIVSGEYPDHLVILDYFCQLVYVDQLFLVMSENDFSRRVMERHSS